MFREIFNFELRHHLRSPVFWLSAIALALLSFGAVTTDVVTVGGAIGNVNRNSPFVISQILLVMSLIGTFVITAFVANAVLRDREYGTEELFYTSRLNRRDYLLGRFAGSLAAAWALYVIVCLGMLIGSFMPWLEPERLGPTMIQPYVVAMVVIVLPNLLLMGAIFFGLVTLTRSMMYTYVGVVAFFVAWGVSAAQLSDIENERLAALLDPFGAAAFSLTTRYWTTAERNSSLLGLDSLMLTNRLLWLSVGIVVLGITFWRFRFTSERRMGAGRDRSEAVAGAEAVAASSTGTGLDGSGAVARAAGGAASRGGVGVGVAQFLHQLRVEVGRVFRSLPFLILLVLGVLNLVGLSLQLDQLVGTSVYPRTVLMLQAIQGAYLVFAIVLLTIYAGEIVWRERGVGMSDVFDAMPVPTWVMWASKLGALFAVLIAILLAGMLTTMAIQLAGGFTDVEPGLYLAGLMLEIGVPFVLLGVLAVFLQVVVNQKFVGFLMMVLYFVSLPAMNALHFEHHLYQYATSPSAVYSDMNGYGHFVEPLFWFYLYWTFAAVMLGVLIQLLWVRGRDTAFRTRLRLARQRLTRPALVTFGVAALAFIATGGFIYRNTNVLNHYVPANVQMDRQARYERDYRKYEGIPQPRIVSVYADVDIYPERRDVDIRGRYVLRNKTDSMIDSLHVLLDTDVVVRALDLPGATVALHDSVLGYTIYRLARPMAPGDTMVVPFDLAVVTRGFQNDGSNTNLVRNGTFFNNFDYFPHIGYTRAFELQDPNERRRRDLPPVERMPKLEDESARVSNYLTSESDWIDFETVVSTSPDQIAIAPGYLQKEWTENGRRYFHYRMDAPILGFFAYLSADWQVARDRWNDVAIEVYYDAKHPYNVARMIESVKKSLDYFTTNFGPYQHRQVRIVEFPRYATFAQSFPNTIPFSEAIGFISKRDDPSDIDYVFYVTAHEVAHQWWAHQVIGANVQGATVMSETMAQYSALMVMEKEFGPDYMRRFLRYELDRYLAGRGGERIEELPLLRVENQPYIHYRKGSVIMYALKDLFGEESLNRALAGYIRRVAFQQPPYTTSREFLDALREAAPEGREQVLEDFFVNITLYDNRATEATYTRRADGKYVVTLTAESHKFRASGGGEETEVPLDDWIDIGVFGEKAEGGPDEGRVLFMEKRHVTGTSNVFEVVVDEQPRRAGIDPYDKLIDRDPANNTTAVGAGR